MGVVASRPTPYSILATNIDPLHRVFMHSIQGFPQFIATRFRARATASKVRFIATRNEPTEPTMISRLTAFAAIFAVVTTASIVCATNVRQHHVADAQVKPQIVMLERVVVTGHRTVTSH